MEREDTVNLFKVRSVAAAGATALLVLLAVTAPMASAQVATTGVQQIGLGVDPTHMANVGGTLFFAAGDSAHGRELWKSDGTSAGTKRVRDVRPGTGSSNPSGLTNVGGVLYFSANDGVHGRELWKSDGTLAGTKPVRDIRSGPKGSVPDNLTDVNGVLFFSANDGIHGNELWKSNGTAAGTKLVRDLNPGSGGSELRFFLSHAGKLFFTQMPFGQVTDQCPWISDGTATGTRRISSGWHACDAALPANVAGTLFFAVDAGLWRLNDVTERAELVSAKPSGLGNLTNVAGTLFFGGYNAVSSQGLWKSDGTDDGTKLLKDVNPDIQTYPEWIAGAGTTAYFSIDDGVHGIELWKSDGTHIGTVLVKDIAPGSTGGYPNDSDPYSPVAIGSTLYFVANDGTHGYELWKSDGSEVGTQRLTDINPSGSSNIGLVTRVGGTLFFNANDGVHGPRLWSYTP